MFKFKPNLIIAFLLMLFYYPISAYSVEHQVILMVGDSLSAAYGMHPAEGWVSLLDKRLEEKGLPYQMVNISTSGDTTSNGLNKLKTALKEYQPKIVILGLGSNDGLRGLPIEEIRKNLKQMILLSKEAGAKVLLIGFLMPTNYGKKYTTEFKNTFADLAKKYQLHFIPFLLKDIVMDSSLLLEDQLHPNSKAQPIILDNVWPELEKMLRSPPQFIPAKAGT